MSQTAYFLCGCDGEIVKQWLPAILEQLGLNSSSPVVVSSRRHLEGVKDIESLPQLFMSLCRKYSLLRNERVTLLSAMDQLIAVQLQLAEKNKEERGDYDVESSVVIQTNRDIIERKLNTGLEDSPTEDCWKWSAYRKFLHDCNYVDMCDVLSLVSTEVTKNEELRKDIAATEVVFVDVPRGTVEKAMVSFLCKDKVVHRVTVEVPLDTESNVMVSCAETGLDSLLDHVTGASTVKKPALSITDAYVRLVFLSYMELLINSRSELALARVINVPERELSHTAFTDIKHEAKKKKMTMYQTAVSYVMRVQLGGKGYAPDPNCALAKHIKGLGEFVTLLQKMQTVIEEEQDSRIACRRVVNIVKREIIKCRDNKIRVSSVESVAESLQERITEIINSIETRLCDTPDKSVCNGGSLLGRRTLKVLRHLLDKLSTQDEGVSTLDSLTDVYSNQKTPIRFPSILSQFRSPEDDPDSPESDYNTSLSERLMNKQNNRTSLSSVLTDRYKSNYDWAEPVHNFHIKDEDFDVKQAVIIPSKTIIHPGSNKGFGTGVANKVLESIRDQENVDQTKNPVENPAEKPVEKKEPKQKSKKRPLQTEPENQPEKKKKTQNQSKTCRRKLLTQVKGQQQLTKFFRV